ncbi:MAG TPA: transglycosylase domain-containing protein [Bacillota bacterium]|nr:transglycosylase domain-containing protein [Bacillota bacterium]
MTIQNTNEDKPKTSKGRKIWRILSIVFQVTTLLLIMGAVFSGGVASGYVASLVKDDPLRSYNEISEKITSNYLTGFAYFNDKTLIGQLRTEEDRRLVKKEEVSPHLVNAIIATEDRHFYEHRGVDMGGILRATVQELTGSSVQTGGSTLTQQLIKQTLLSPKVTHERKAKEIFLALRVERMFSKDQILEAYMNEMYFGQSANGSNIYGVQAAARGIFGVDAKDLSIPQAAYIAGMLQAPSRYIPFNKDGLISGKKRQEIVLARMKENGYITEQQYQDGMNYDIEAHLAQSKQAAYSKYPFLMMDIEDRAAKVLVEQDLEKEMKTRDSVSKDEYRQLLDKKRKEILRGGYHIYTTIDKKVYEMMTAIAEEPKNFAPNKSYKVKLGTEDKEIKNALEEVGATLIDNKSGAILGFIGGRDFKISQVNHTIRPRQPGSAMKPIAAYAPAFEKGILQPGSVIDDAPIGLDNGAGNPLFYPSNWNNKYQGLITAREALKMSYNIPAIKTYLKVGIPEALSYVEKMGVTTIVTPKDNPRNNDFQAKTGVIGGLTQGLTVEEITNAYTTFPNQGSFLDAYMIDHIDNSHGENIYQHQVKPQSVFSEQTSYLTTDMMKTVVQEGTAVALQKMIKGNHEIAGKTGTTNDDYDSWFVGYTPEATLGVWIGYDIPYTITKAPVPHSLTVWGKIMNGLFDLYPQKYPNNTKFTEPAGIVEQEVCSVSGKLPTELCRQAGTVISEVFNQKYVPTETCDVHQTAKVIKYNGKLYLAKPETPSDMIEEKVAIKSSGQSSIQDGSSKPLDSDSRLPDAVDPRTDDGKAPSKPHNVTLNDGKITWSENSEADIVGYRIYRSALGGPFEKTGVTHQGNEPAFTLPGHGLYYVTAVDVSGKESAPAEPLSFGGEKTQTKSSGKGSNTNTIDPLNELIPPEANQGDSSTSSKPKQNKNQSNNSDKLTSPSTN